MPLPNQPIADVQAIYAAAVEAVGARALLRPIDLDALVGRPLGAYRRVVVVGAGKASMAMAGALEERLGDAALDGLVVVPHGYTATGYAATDDAATLPASERAPRRIQVAEAGHPVPDEAGVRAAQAVLEKVAACGAGDLVLVLLSGGGSALWPAPAAGLALSDVQRTSRLLLESGASIHEINAVRKHLSRIKGGRLAATAYPADVRALALSDVVGDDLSVIASGPTVPDPSTFREAADVLRGYGLWERTPTDVRARLEKGSEDAAMETPKPGSDVFWRTRTSLIGSNRTALEAARHEADVQGYAARIVAGGVTGEAREVGRRLAEEALGVTDVRPTCLLWGGETTVTVRGQGEGRAEPRSSPRGGPRVGGGRTSGRLPQRRHRRHRRADRRGGGVGHAGYRRPKPVGAASTRKLSFGRTTPTRSSKGWARSSSPARRTRT